MPSNCMNMTKANFRAEIKRKQAFFNRCKRRYQVAVTPGERQFLKSEANRICKELKQCCKKWTNCGFGACTWITRNFNMSCFIKGTNRKTNSRVRSGVRSTSRRTTNSKNNRTKRTVGRRITRSKNRSRTPVVARSYVAW